MTTLQKKAEEIVAGWEIAEMFGQDDVQEVPTNDIKDMVDVAAAYLAEHPCDEDEPVTMKLLDDLGADRDVDGAIQIRLANGTGNAVQFIKAATGSEWCVWLRDEGDGSEIYIRKVSIRGQVHSLLNGLGGIPTPNQPEEKGQ